MNRASKLLALPAVVLTASVLLTGCIPESKAPLGDAATARPDASLMGLWQAKMDNGDVQYYHIGLEPEKALDPKRTTPESGLMKFWLIGHGAENRQVSNPFGMQMFASTVGDGQYLNLVVPANGPPATPPVTYWFIKYQVDKETLTTWGMSWEGTAKVIEEGKLSGTIERDAEGKLKRVLLTASRDELQTYLKDNATTLFPPENKNVYKRVTAG